MRTWIELDKKVFDQNITNLELLIQKPMIAMVKSNAYGHGLKEMIELAQPHVLGFGFADASEALKARQFTKKRCMVFGATEENQWQELAENDIEIAVTSTEMVAALENVNQKLKLHIKINTGLNRYGINREAAQKIDLRSHEIVGIYSHFSSVEEGDIDWTKTQLDRFKQAAHTIDPDHKMMWHIAASAAAIILPETRLDAVRLGISMYGCYASNSPQEKEAIPLVSVLQWKACIAAIHEVGSGETIGYGNTFKTANTMRVAVLPVGYADGYDRSLSNAGQVIISGQLCPIVGRVFMNTIIVDITKIHDVQVGDIAILIGKEGDNYITADDLAKAAGTINYEILARLSNEIERRVI